MFELLVAKGVVSLEPVVGAGAGAPLGKFVSQRVLELNFSQLARAVEISVVSPVH